MKRFLTVLFCVVVLSGICVWILVTHVPKSHRIEANTNKAPEVQGGLERPTMHTERPVAPVETATPVQSQSPAEELTQVQLPHAPIREKKYAPLTIYTAQNVQADPTPQESLGDYAPVFRMVRCKLVNTVDSSNGPETPIDGLVTDDVVWRGKIIIPKCSEVHGTVQIDKARERIVADGVWTFVLAEPDGLGDRELVVKGMALDRQDDPEFTQMMVGSTRIDTIKGTWGITDGSVGLRGVIIKTNNTDIINAFVAAFIGGMAGTVTQFSTVIAPEQGGSSVSLPSYVAAPAAQGISSVMELYARQVMESIEKDGFFIRVPAGKLFYVRVSEELFTGKATVGGFKQRNKEVQSEFLEDRAQNEKMSEPRSQRDDRKQNGFPNVPSIDPALTRRLDEATQNLERRSEELANPTPTP